MISLNKKLNFSKLVKNAIIILIISLLLITLPEIILRIVSHEKLSDIIPTSTYEFNKDYGYVLKASIETSTKRNKGDIIVWKTNKNSFRGAELKDNPEKRIIVYGDSNIQAEFSILENTFTAKLGKYLNSSGLKDIEVVNAGTIGFGPDQNLLRFINEAKLYNPYLVIFHVFADNDFGDILRNRLFSLDEKGELIDSGYKFTIDEFKRERNRTLKRYYLNNLLTAKIIKKFFQSFKKKKNAGREEKRIEEMPEDIYQARSAAEYLNYKEARPRKWELSWDHYDIDIALNPGQESSKIQIKLMEAVLKKANNFARSNGIEFLVLIQPSVVDLRKNNFNLNYEYLQKFPHYQKNNLTGAVERICASNNINYINLFDIFKNNNPDKLYFRAGDNHWNDKGQDFAAQVTASFVLNRYMLTD